MINPIETIRRAISMTFSNPKYHLVFIFLSILFFLLYIAVPVFASTDQSVASFLNSTTNLDFLIFSILSIFMSLITIMQIHLWDLGKKTEKKNVVLGTTGLFSSLFSTLFMTATCAACVSFLFSFLGFGSALFFYEYRFAIIGVSFLIVAVSLFFSSRQIVYGCEICTNGFLKK